MSKNTIPARWAQYTPGFGEPSTPGHEMTPPAARDALPGFTACPGPGHDATREVDHGSSPSKESTEEGRPGLDDIESNDLGYEGDGSIDTSVTGTTLHAIAGVRDSALGTHAKVVAYTLLSRCQLVHEEGWVCWPSLARIAKDCGMSRNTVRKALAELGAAGLVAWRSGGTYIEQGEARRYTSRYTLNYRALMALRKRRK